MHPPLIAVTDSVFPDLVSTREVPLKAGAELRLAESQTPEAIRQVAKKADGIHTARGEIVDEPALAQALDAGQLAGAALNALPGEPPIHSPLFGRDI